MKTKIAIFNDLQKTMHLQIQEADGSRYQTLYQATATMVEYEIPDGTIPFLKVWSTGQGFLSFIDSEVIF